MMCLLRLNLLLYSLFAPFSRLISEFIKISPFDLRIFKVINKEFDYPN